MKIYMLDMPECAESILVLQATGLEVEIIVLEDPLGQKHLFQDTSDVLQSLIILPLYLSKDSSYQMALLDLAEAYEVPILFVYKRSKKLKDPQVMPKKTIFESLALPASSVEIKLKLRALQNISMQLYSARMKERELESLSRKAKENLRFAQNFQQLVLPTSIQKKDIEIHGLFQPSSELSGDLFYWLEVEDGKYGFIIIDVCGKGVHAALISMSIRSLMPGLIKRVKDPTIITKELNKHMNHLFKEYQKVTTRAAYFTAFIAFVDSKARVIEYVNNGHPPAMMYSPCNNQFQSLSKGSMPIGLVPDMPIEKGVIHYEAGSRFIIYTDGLSESPKNHIVHRFEKIEQEFIDNVHLDTADLLQELLLSRMKHSEINDDICIIAGTLF